MCRNVMHHDLGKFLNVFAEQSLAYAAGYCLLTQQATVFAMQRATAFAMQQAMICDCVTLPTCRVTMFGISP